MRDLAIDLGTTTVSVLARGEGIILTEPSVLARVIETGEVVAVGDAAAKMMGRTPDGLEAIRPIRSGAITDFDSAEAMIRSFLHRVGVRRINRPRIVVCVPSSVTPVEQRAVREAANRAGAAEVRLLGHAMAAALGAGLPVDQPRGSMVVDIGGGTTEAAVVSLGGLVALESRRLGGLDLDARIQAAVDRRHGLTISSAEAALLKHEIASAAPLDHQPTPDRRSGEPGHPGDGDGDGGEDGDGDGAGAGDGEHDAGRPAGRVVRGRSVTSGAVEEVFVSAVEVSDAIHDGVMTMIDAVVDCLGWTPPEIAHDLIGDGIQLAGGGALLHDMAETTARHTKVPVTVVDRPEEVVAIGAGRCLGLFAELEGFFLGDYSGSFR